MRLAQQLNLFELHIAVSLRECHRLSVSVQWNLSFVKMTVAKPLQQLANMKCKSLSLDLLLQVYLLEESYVRLHWSSFEDYYY